MNILFLTMNSFTGIDTHSIYADLMCAFIAHGHRPYIVTPLEKKTGEPTQLIELRDHGLLKVRIGNTSGVSLIEKGISTVTLSGRYERAIRRYLGHIAFDLIIYSTPPITLAHPIKVLKRKWNCPTYLMLKDIFPQNAVDLGMMKTAGPTSLLYRYFLKKEKKLYALSDRIGCMSPANVAYVLAHNPEIAAEKVELCPNCIEPQDMRISLSERLALREKYGLPLDKKLFVYGGNLGKPQGIPFIIECLRECSGIDDAFFLIVGDGTEYGKLAAYIRHEKPGHVKLMQRLPREDYDRMIGACDVGLIFLDHRFTIPNFPSRLLSYMQAGLPVLACTDTATDIGKVVVDGGFGWWCESNDARGFSKKVESALMSDSSILGAVAQTYLLAQYSTDKGYGIITNEQD